MRTVDDYLALLPALHADKPNFTATLAGVLGPLVETYNALAATPAAFDVDTATGAQLDVVGQWVGVSRLLSVPITGVYFSYDTSGVGFDQGVWYQSGDSTQGVQSLDDDTYRAVIKMKIAANNWDGTLAGAQAIFASLAALGITVKVQDNFDMTISLTVTGAGNNSSIVAVLRQAFTWMRPAGVALTGVTVS